MGKYFAALCKEIMEKGKMISFPVNHIYIGGGTPSVACWYFPRLKEAIYSSFTIAEGAEISVECNPESITLPFVSSAKKLGVNRVSVGIQTLSDPLLKTIGRAHDRAYAIMALDRLTQSFPSVNADIM